MPVRVFVYGTLMRGMQNAHHMGDAVWLGRAQTTPRWALVSLGPWPAMIPGSQVVHGEVFAVRADELPRLDAFEDVPELYHRVRIEIADGPPAQAWVMPSRRAALGDPIPGGDWRRVTPTAGPARVVYDVSRG